MGHLLLMEKLWVCKMECRESAVMGEFQQHYHLLLQLLQEQKHLCLKQLKELENQLQQLQQLWQLQQLQQLQVLLQLQVQLI